MFVRKQTSPGPDHVQYVHGFLGRCIIFLVFLMFVNSGSAQAVVWTGWDGFWDSNINWDLGFGYPDAGEDVYIIDSIYQIKRVTYSNSNYNPELNSLHINTASSAEGTTVLYQGRDKLIVRDEYIGSDVNPAGRGAVIQGGGEHTILNNQYLGYRPGNTGEYKLLSIGKLTTSGTTYVGYEGNGTFTQEGGVHATERLVVGEATTGDGEYRLIDGSLEVKSITVIGNEGIGRFVQEGGNHSVENLTVKSPVAAAYWLKDGNLTVDSNEYIGPGYGGQSTSFVQEGGLHTVKGAIYLGTNKVEGYPSSYYFLKGGELNVNLFVIGERSPAFVQQDGGALRARGIALGVNIAGLYMFNSGSLVVEEQLWVASHGVFYHNNGDSHVNRLDIEGTYSQRTGTLSANRIRLIEDGQYQFGGGRLSMARFEGDLINEGGVLVPGSSPGTTVITGDYTHSVNAVLEMELGGLEQGLSYDFLNVEQTMTLYGGVLQILFWEDFTASLGDSFDLLDWGLLVGEFGVLRLPDLEAGLFWDTSRLYLDGSIFVGGESSTAPIPGAVWLLGSGLVGLAGLRRKLKG